MFSKNKDFFHFDMHRHDFEDFSLQDRVGIRYWRARDFMKMLGYDDCSFFYSTIQLSCDLCISLGIDHTKNFLALSKSKDFSDCRLSKFACYLVAMNCDINKKEVENAQAYFTAITESFYRFVCEQEPMILTGNINYQFFKNKKNLALFNMSYYAERGIRFGDY
jgi:DNA-damage-inducible protein D